MLVLAGWGGVDSWNGRVFLRGLGGFRCFIWGGGICSEGMGICQCWLVGWGGLDSWAGCGFVGRLCGWAWIYLADCGFGALVDRFVSDWFLA